MCKQTRGKIWARESGIEWISLSGRESCFCSQNHTGDLDACWYLLVLINGNCTWKSSRQFFECQAVVLWGLPRWTYLVGLFPMHLLLEVVQSPKEVGVPRLLWGWCSAVQCLASIFDPVASNLWAAWKRCTLWSQRRRCFLVLMQATALQESVLQLLLSSLVSHQQPHTESSRSWSDSTCQ